MRSERSVFSLAKNVGRLKAGFEKVAPNCGFRAEGRPSHKVYPLYPVHPHIPALEAYSPQKAMPTYRQYQSLPSGYDDILLHYLEMQRQQIELQREQMEFLKQQQALQSEQAGVLKHMMGHIDSSFKGLLGFMSKGRTSFKKPFFSKKSNLAEEEQQDEQDLNDNLPIKVRVDPNSRKIVRVTEH